MSSDNAEGNVKDLEKKIDGLAQDIEKLNKRITPLDDLPDLMKKIDSLTKELEVIKSKVEDDEKLDSLAKDISTIKESKEMDVLFKKIDDLLLSVTEMGSKVDDANSSEGISTLDEKFDGFSTSITELTTNIEQLRDSDSTEVIGKKIDDLQQYVAGLSALEEKVDSMASAFSETKEIVGIIVRQLRISARPWKSSNHCQMAVTSNYPHHQKIQESQRGVRRQKQNLKKNPLSRLTLQQLIPS